MLGRNRPQEYDIMGEYKDSLVKKNMKKRMMTKKKVAKKFVKGTSSVSKM